jgi:hypothetical protein
MIIPKKRFSRHRHRLGDARAPPAAGVVWVKFACFPFMRTEPFAVLPSSEESLMSLDSMPTHPAEHRCAVLIIGDGPAGR